MRFRKSIQMGLITTILAKPLCEGAVNAKSSELKLGEYSCNLQKMKKFNTPTGPLLYFNVPWLNSPSTIKVTVDQNKSGKKYIYPQFRFPYLIKGSKLSIFEPNVRGTINIMGDSKFEYTLIKDGGKPFGTANHTYQCKLDVTTKAIPSSAPPNENSIPIPQLQKGVFIRTCPAHLYYSDSFNKTQDALDLGNIRTIPVGTLKGVCEDLKESGVTDIFIPFKVDDEENAPTCGKHGELLYSSSKYPDRISQIVKNAKAAGFDPNGALISVCKQVYGSTQINFHAWFPTFKDPYAAQIEGVKGTIRFRGNPLDELITDLQNILGLSGDRMFRSSLFSEPSSSKVGDYQIELLSEIVAMYPEISGINLDYIRYPERRSVVDEKIDKPLYKIDVLFDEINTRRRSENKSDLSVEKVEWQTSSYKVAEFVRRVKTVFPQKILSADVFPDISVRYEIAQNMMLGNVDVIMPMAYSNFMTGDNEQIRILLAKLKTDFSTKKIVPCLRGWKHGDQKTSKFISELREDIQAAKNASVEGYSIFTYESFLSDSESSNLKNRKKDIGY